MIISKNNETRIEKNVDCCVQKVRTKTEKSELQERDTERNRERERERERERKKNKKAIKRTAIVLKGCIQLALIHEDPIDGGGKRDIGLILHSK